MRLKDNQTTPAHLRWYFAKRLALMALGAGIALVIASFWVQDNPVDEAEVSRDMRRVVAATDGKMKVEAIDALIANVIDDKRRATAHSMAAWGAILAIAGLVVATGLAREQHGDG